MLGIFPIPKKNLKSLNLQNFQTALNRLQITFVVMFLLLYFVSVLNFVMTKASNFAQYAEGTLFCIIVFTRLTFYYLINSKRSRISAMINDLETIIHKSKWNINCCGSVSFHIVSMKLFFFFLKWWTGNEQSTDLASVYQMRIVEVETFVTRIWTYFAFTISLNPLIKVYQSYYNYFVLDRSDKSFRLLFPTT